MKDLNYSEVEARRFKMNIYRGVISDLNVKQLNKKILEESIDIAILRIPSEKKIQISRLDKLPFPYFQADTLLYYYVDFEKYTPQKLRNDDLKFVVFNKRDYNTLDKLVEEIFSGYTNHYFSNPSIDKSEIIEGYKEWVRGYSVGDGKIGWLVQKNGEDIGFATCNTGLDGGIAEGVLYGVLSSASGGGIYTDIIRFTQDYMKNAGCNQMKVSTQVQNYAVQKVWAREGFFLKESFDTIHINSMLNFSVIPAKTIELVISKSDIEKYGEASGDLNPVHFNDEFANKLGFEGRIAHGLIPVSLISKYFGTEFPGEGILFIGYSYKFLKPLYPDKKYSVSISFPAYDKDKGRYLSLVKFIDENDELCLLSYNHLLKKNVQDQIEIS